MSKPLTPLELQLQMYAPQMFSLHMLMKDEMDGGGGDRKLILLIDTIVQYNNSMATGNIIIDYSKGKISHIDTKVRITADTGLPRNRE